MCTVLEASCNATFTINIDNCSVAMPDLTSLVNVTKNCDVYTVNQSIAVGTLFSTKGNVPVNFTIADNSGNTAFCQVLVQVNYSHTENNFVDVRCNASYSHMSFDIFKLYS